MAGSFPVEWPARLNPYSLELRFQLSAANAAFSSLEDRIAKRKALARDMNRFQRKNGIPVLAMERRVFFDKYLLPLANASGPILGDVQAFLAALGVAQSILWPSSKRYRGESNQEVEARLARGEEIRKLLNVPDNSILKPHTRGDEDVRGGFLHFDEMIDEFRKTHTGDEFVGFDLGSAKDGTTVRRTKAVRWLDEDSLELWVNGRKGDLRAIWAELQRYLGTIHLSTDAKMIVGRRQGPEPTAFGVAYGARTDR